MTRTAANASSENATGPSRIIPSKAEGLALCSTFILTIVFVVGNLLAIVLFAVSRRLRRRSLLLVINMAFANLMLGTLTLPIYIYSVGNNFELWKGGTSMSLSIFYTIVDTFSSQASLISAAFISGERFYAIYWPFKPRTLSMRAYRIIIFFNCLIYLFDVQIQWKFYDLVNVINYSNSFANPVVYALRIP